MPLSEDNLSKLKGLFGQFDKGKDIFFHYFKTAETVMNTKVKYLTPDHKISQGLAFLEALHVRHIPIVETASAQQAQNNKGFPVLVGIVSQRDLALASSAHEKLSPQDAFIQNQPLGFLMTPHPISVCPDTSVFEVVHTMIEKKFDCLLVVKRDSTPSVLTGIITTTDILHLFNRLQAMRDVYADKESSDNSPHVDSVTAGADQNAFFEGTAGKIQNKIQTMPDSATLLDAAQLMQDHNLRHLLVTNSQGKLCGVVSDRDVLKHLPSQIPDKEGDAKSRKPKYQHHLINVNEGWDDAWKKTLITDIMIKSPITAAPHTPLIEVVELFCDKHIGCMPIVDDKTGEIKGIITRTDIMKAILDIGE